MKTVGVLALVIAGLVAMGLPATDALRYTVYKSKVSFYEAWQQCIANGGSLASIQLASQNANVLAAIQAAGGDGGWWLSGTDVGLEGSWVWFSTNKAVGTPYGFVNFAAGEPSNSGTNGENCLSMNIQGTWNDDACDKLLYYVCEFYSQ
ncbi:pulmonary surfactant-associated protein D-like [Anopheles maculipalpis]|uniref:pulmonary surfactant-associated protein D-like n=1 Tax=Anopheles maculipalpis TaxID=1496333 RepID=UPI00215964B9|nr:pulmonary surfactant-associated protein D-like [Anopheles maculipalpis]